MGEKKVAIMVLKVNLQCSKCYLKVKKVLCKFHQIQDQVYDEKLSKVTIKVVCCSPEKIRDKICREGGCSIKCIEILPDKSKQPKRPAPEPEPEQPKETAPAPPPAPVPEPAPDPAPVPVPEPGRVPIPDGVCCRECYEGRGGGPCYQLDRGRGRCDDGYTRPENPAPAPCYPWVPNRVGVCCRECYEGRGGGPCYQRGPGHVRCDDSYCGPEKVNPVGECCRECYEGRSGGPCYQLGRGQVRCDGGHYGPEKPATGPVPVPCYPPVPNPVVACCRECYEGRGGGPCHQLGYGQVRYDVGYYGRPVYDSWGSGSSGCDKFYYKSRCPDYISEENPTACRIM